MRSSRTNTSSAGRSVEAEYSVFNRETGEWEHYDPAKGPNRHPPVEDNEGCGCLIIGCFLLCIFIVLGFGGLWLLLLILDWITDMVFG